MLSMSVQYAREQCVKAVVMTPTRELCNQAAKNIAVSRASIILYLCIFLFQRVTFKDCITVTAKWYHACEWAGTVALTLRPAS